MAKQYVMKKYWKINFINVFTVERVYEKILYSLSTKSSPVFPLFRNCRDFAAVGCVTRNAEDLNL